MNIVSSVSRTGFILLALLLTQCQPQNKLSEGQKGIDTIWINQGLSGLTLEFDLAKGKSHNHPSFAIWVEDLEGNYIKSLYATRSIATGIFGHGAKDSVSWDTKPGQQFRPASLPYWLHKRSGALGTDLVPSPEQPVTDAYTGATPVGDFSYKFTEKDLPESKFNILMEINQPWDWNEYWTTTLYQDRNYKTSCQPSVVYSVIVDPKKKGEKYFLNPIGHGHFSGADGKLYTDLRTLTTALHIIDFASVTIVK